MYSFSKSPRKNLAKRTYCDAYYNLGSSVKATTLDRKRTPSFGIGVRMGKGPAAREAEKKPAPGHYRVRTTFEMDKD